MIPPKLSDTVISLRPFTLDDSKEHLAGDDAENIKWLSGGVSTLKNVQDWIIRNQKYWEQDGPIYNFAIVDQTNTLVGMVEGNSDRTVNKVLREGDVNISYSIYPTFRGKGYASRAVRLLLQFLKKKKFVYGIICVNPENAKSLGVPKRCGFKQKGEVVSDKGETLLFFEKKL